MTLEMNRRYLLKGVGGTIVSVAAAALTKGTAFAQTTRHLRIGLATPPTSLDPHFANSGTNNPVAWHSFDALIQIGPRAESLPSLAVAWRPLDDTTWELDLRPDVKFSDGSPFTAEDAAASLLRAKANEGPLSYRIYVENVKDISTPDPLKLVLTTNKIDVLFPNTIARTRIVNHRFKDAPPELFNSGEAMVGTGPYVFSKYTEGSELVLTANPHYWGEKGDWDTVTIVAIPDAAARLAALLSGDVDIIEQPPYTALERIESDPDHKVVRGVGSRIIFLAMDQYRDVTPFATDASGTPLPQNPFKDKRVREAFSRCIDRNAIVDKVMAGNALAASQFYPTGTFGTAEDLQVIPAELDRAKALLADAGYPDGFSLTIHGPVDRYVNSPQNLQAVAQMLTRLGIHTQVETIPWSVYSGKTEAAEYSVSLYGYGPNTGETSNPMKVLVATYDKERGSGSRNIGRYSNPDLDAKLNAATSTIDDDKRKEILVEASRIAINDFSIIPLHHESVVEALSSTIDYSPRMDENILAIHVKQV